LHNCAIRLTVKEDWTLKLNIVPLFMLVAIASVPAAKAVSDDSSKKEVVPAFKLSPAELTILKENCETLKRDQALVRKVLAKEHLPIYEPVTPNYQLISENSLLAVLNQLEYLELAHKVGAEKPPRPDLKTGSALENNRFLHAYNDALLHSIAKKLGIAVEPMDDLKAGSASEQGNRLLKQNSDVLVKIARHLGVAN
jgi:hypothetical protein